MPGKSVGGVGKVYSYGGPGAGRGVGGLGKSPDPLDPARKAYERIKAEHYRIFGPARADKILSKMAIADSGQIILPDGNSLDPYDDPVGTTTYIDELIGEKPMPDLAAESPSSTEPQYGKAAIDELGRQSGGRITEKDITRLPMTDAPPGPTDMNAAAAEADERRSVMTEIQRLTGAKPTDQDFVWLSEQPLEELWGLLESLKPTPEPDPNMIDIADGVKTNRPGAVRVVQPRRGAR